MQAVILCGGKGTRMGELGENIPKPLINVGNRPVIWHIMNIYSYHGVNDFILCLGYKGDKIRKYFEENKEEKWNITLVDTGDTSLKSERLKMIRKFLKHDNFFVAYGDDLSDVDINRLLQSHLKSNKIVTITAVNPVVQFGVAEIEGNEVVRFQEKPKSDKWINGGFMVMNKKIFDYTDLGELEQDVFARLAKDRQINAYKHNGSWTTMNTLKDHIELNEMWNSDKAFWKKW